MTTLQMLILVAAVAVGLGILWIAIGKVYQADEKDEKMVKYVLLFDKKSKKFYEQRSDEFEEEEDVVMIAINDYSLLNSFNRFLTAELYHVSTVNQAHRVFDIYLESRTSDNSSYEIKYK